MCTRKALRRGPGTRGALSRCLFHEKQGQETAIGQVQARSWGQSPEQEQEGARSCPGRKGTWPFPRGTQSSGWGRREPQNL